MNCQWGSPLEMQWWSFWKTTTLWYWWRIFAHTARLWKGVSVLISTTFLLVSTIYSTCWVGHVLQSHFEQAIVTNPELKQQARARKCVLHVMMYFNLLKSKHRLIFYYHFVSAASYLQLRCLSSGAVCTPGQWQLVSAVCLQRLPVITAEKTPLEERFGSLMEQLELESSLLSNHELHAREDQ